MAKTLNRSSTMNSAKQSTHAAAAFLRKRSNVSTRLTSAMQRPVDVAQLHRQFIARAGNGQSAGEQRVAVHVPPTVEASVLDTLQHDSFACERAGLASIRRNGSCRPSYLKRQAENGGDPVGHFRRFKQRRRRD